jgi:hypothetical protein
MNGVTVFDPTLEALDAAIPEAGRTGKWIWGRSVERSYQAHTIADASVVEVTKVWEDGTGFMSTFRGPLRRLRAQQFITGTGER